MKSRGFFRATSHRLLVVGRRLRSLRAAIPALLLAITSSSATPLPPLAPPITFFTNVAQRLLKSELNLDLTQIQIYPTNQYTQALHRLLQLAANLYDASTNRADTGYPYLPSVFRPLFTNDNGTVYICGYEEVVDASLAVSSTAPPIRDLSDPASRAQLQSHDMVHGVPLVIGAKKGWPNFNEFAMQTQVQVTRKLQFVRTGGPTTPVNRTNQMYVLSVSNVFGVEAWNSYRTPVSRPLQITLAVQPTGVITNEFTILSSNNTAFFAIPSIAANQWVGFTNVDLLNDGSYFLPLYTNYYVLSNMQYLQVGQPGAHFAPLLNYFDFESPSGLAVPRWWLTLQTRMRYFLVDTGVVPNRIVDYVALNAVENPIDITQALMSDGNCGPSYFPDGGRGSQWCTNLFKGAISFGILSQIFVCNGAVGDSEVQDWRNFVTVQGGGVGDINERDAARALFNSEFDVPPPPGNINFFAPFNPTRAINFYTTWQANDPLVHYTIGDLIGGDRTNRFELDTTYYTTMTNLGRMNGHYEPWGGGGSHGLSSSITLYDRTVKDPCIAQGILPSGSEDWNFPTNLTLDPSSIGRVHRGTPWQTIYLKSAAANTTTWTKWSGATNQSVSLKMHPTNDWHIVSLLMPLLNTNAPGNLLSLNQPDVPSWRSALDGIVVLTNSQSSGPPLDAVVMSANSPQAASIASALDTSRSNRPGHFFRGLGEILSASALSITSPWLNTNSTSSLSDDAYEAIPSQLLTRLRLDSVATLTVAPGQISVQFTGFDDWRYAILTSSNLKDWTSISTNYPVNGVFGITNTSPLQDVTRIYKSTLLP